jgi:hypothetical protein
MRVDNESGSRDPRRRTAESAGPAPHNPRRTKNEQWYCYRAYGRKHRVVNRKTLVWPHRASGHAKGLPAGQTVGKRHPSLDDGEKPSYRVKQPRTRNQKVGPSHVGAFRQANRTLTER